MFFLSFNVIRGSCDRIENNGFQVTILADKFSPNVTSDVAAGFIEPYLCGDDVDRIVWVFTPSMRIFNIRSFKLEMDLKL